MNNKMAINIYLSTMNLKNKLSKQAEQTQNHNYRESFDGSQMEGEMVGIGEKVKGLRSTNW